MNWKGQIFGRMRNWTANNRQTGVGNSLKKHYANFLWEYEQVRTTAGWGCGCAQTRFARWCSVSRVGVQMRQSVSVHALAVFTAKANALRKARAKALHKQRSCPAVALHMACLASLPPCAVSAGAPS